MEMKPHTEDDRRAHEDQCAREEFESEGKKAINDLIWTYMPSALTLGEADDIAGAIHDMFSDAWNKAAEDCEHENGAT